MQWEVCSTFLGTMSFLNTINTSANLTNRSLSLLDVGDLLGVFMCVTAHAKLTVWVLPGQKGTCSGWSFCFPQLKSLWKALDWWVSGTSTFSSKAAKSVECATPGGLLLMSPSTSVSQCLGEVRMFRESRINGTRMLEYVD